MISTPSHYWLQNAHVPACLLDETDVSLKSRQNTDGLSLVHLEIAAGAIAQIVPATNHNFGETTVIDCKQGMVWPCFVDIHTHLDKAHIWPRSPNPDGTFNGALETVLEDSAANWTPEDLYRRMEFALKCSYAHGTQAIRTHLDSGGELAEISWEVFKTLQTQWADRMILQAVSLVSLEDFLTPKGELLANQVAAYGGVLGGVAYMNPEIDKQIDRVFTLAKDRQLNLDFHTDETGDRGSITLRKVAEAAIRHQFQGQILCGHCCSLAQQDPAEVQQTLKLVQQANIGIISLPLCNLYLQDRQYTGVSREQHLSIPLPITPRWRGITLVHELAQHKIPVAIASDNCRDPFYGFGDHDVLEVFNQGVRIAHLDHNYGHWPQIVTQIPAHLMGLSTIGRFYIGQKADLILFKGRSFSELLSRSQFDRILIRKGKIVDRVLPDYRELDEVVMHP
ncbi:MAG: cytosine deaminase [Microcoleaceae cyanobacterium]